jgi:isochorismate pyruvate lyase
VTAPSASTAAASVTTSRTPGKLSRLVAASFDTVIDMPTNHGDDKDAQADKEQLAAVRVAVDEVDEQIVLLIGRRERLIRIAGTLKEDSAQVRAPGRVERVIEHVRGVAEKKDIDADIVEKTYRAMTEAFTTLELEVYKASS